jgi:hypothetical protein
MLIHEKKYILYLFIKFIHVQFFTFLNNFQAIIQHSPKHSPIIIMGEFNVEFKKTITIIFHG